MKKIALASMLMAGIGLSLSVQADDYRTDHFEGKSSATLEEAVENFSSHNEKLAQVLASDELDTDALLAIHELTYTLENALEKINVEMAELAETLEALHIASERADFEGAREHGQAYLEGARKVIP